MQNIYPGYGSYGHTTYRRPRPLAPDPFTSRLPLRGVLGVGFTGLGAVAMLGKKTKKDRKADRELKKLEKTEHIAWLETAIAEVKQTILDYEQGAIDPDSTVAYAGVSFTPQGKKEKRLARQLDKLRNVALPRAQSSARLKKQIEQVRGGGMTNVTPPPPPPPPPDYSDPDTLTDTDGNLVYDPLDSGYLDYSGGTIYGGGGGPSYATNPDPSTDVDQTGEDRSGGAFSKMERGGDMVIWIGAIAGGIGAIWALTAMLKRRKRRGRR